jgi:hypothetical protein
MKNKKIPNETLMGVVFFVLGAIVLSTAWWCVTKQHAPWFLWIFGSGISAIAWAFTLLSLLPVQNQKRSHSIMIGAFSMYGVGVLLLLWAFVIMATDAGQG